MVKIMIDSVADCKHAGLHDYFVPLSEFLENHE